jgi:hypothetical protein
VNRRRFLTAAASLSVLRAADTRRDLLLPSDNPDELGFRLMWYNPVRAMLVVPHGPIAAPLRIDLST